MNDEGTNLSRRKFLKLGVGAAGVASAGMLAASLASQTPVEAQANPPQTQGGDLPYNIFTDPQYTMMMPGVGSDVDYVANGFNPSDILTDFDGGQVSTLPNGQTLREYTVVAGEKDIELVPGLNFAAWVYNGRIPGPTIRATEGDRIRINFTNGSSHPHGMHFHGIHPGNMDAVFDQVQPGDSFTYEFDAEPFGCHLYHCHAFPLAKHISKGLYGAFIVDPKDGWPKADHEFVMVQSGFDVDFDGANDFYVVNGIPFHYSRHPIQIKTGELVRIFLINVLEFDPINSFHLHANFFHYYPTGTSLTPSEYTDTIAQMQAQRGILEFSYKYPGLFMFHAHKTEFAELGWTGVFEVTEA